MADQSQAPGFKLLPPGSTATSSGSVTQSAATTAPSLPVERDTTTRDFAVAGGILLVLLVAFFFAKNGYANALVGRKVAPRSANAGAWWLFILLTSLATISVLSVVDQVRFLTVLFVSPFALVALISLSLMLVSSRR
jgi:hypothetical protein